MNIIVTGGTGLVGSEVVLQATAQNDINEIYVLTRRPLKIQHPKVKEIIHTNFLDYSGLEELFKKCDACIWCLGIPQAWVTNEEYHVITYDYSINAAKAMLEVNAEMKFVFVSGGGADSSEKSKITFAREKGKTENALKRMQIKNLVIARPGGIQPIIKPDKAPLSYRISYPFLPLLNKLIPSQFITSRQVGLVLLHLAKNGTSQTILENSHLKKIIKENSLENF